jgi:hypothetical protein
MLAGNCDRHVPLRPSPLSPPQLWVPYPRPAETSLLLLRHREAFAYGAVQEVAAAGEAAAEVAFDRMSIAERSRFK